MIVLQGLIPMQVPNLQDAQLAEHNNVVSWFPIQVLNLRVAKLESIIML